MALVKTKADETATENVTEPEVQEEKVEAQPEVQAETKEVSVKQEAAAPTVANGGFWYNNADVMEVVDTAQYGDFPQIIAAQGVFCEAGSSGVELGKEILFRPIMAKTKWVCAPGSNDEEAKEYFAAAYEGEVTMDGKTIDECVEDAKAAGYDKASKKEYKDLYAYVISHEKGDDFEDEVVVMQLSPMSRIEWNKFSKKLEIRAAFGKLSLDDDGLIIKAVAKAAQNKANQKYTHFQFDQVK